MVEKLQQIDKILAFLDAASMVAEYSKARNRKVSAYELHLESLVWDEKLPIEKRSNAKRKLDEYRSERKIF